MSAHTPDIESYILQHIDPESPYLKALYRDTHLKLLYPRMTSGHLQGRLLKMLVRMIRPKRVLELGTYSGYATLCLAEGLDEDACIYTIEANDEQERFLKKWIDGAPDARKIHRITADAGQWMSQCTELFDLIFIDADKRRYTEFYEAAYQLLTPGGYIIADNTLWNGYVTCPEQHPDEQTSGICRFNDVVSQDERVEKVILPLRDGLTLIRKKQPAESPQTTTHP